MATALRELDWRISARSVGFPSNGSTSTRLPRITPARSAARSSDPHGLRLAPGGRTRTRRRIG